MRVRKAKLLLVDLEGSLLRTHCHKLWQQSCHTRAKRLCVALPCRQALFLTIARETKALSGSSFQQFNSI